MENEKRVEQIMDVSQKKLKYEDRLKILRKFDVFKMWILGISVAYFGVSAFQRITPVVKVHVFVSLGLIGFFGLLSVVHYFVKRSYKDRIERMNSDLDSLSARVPSAKTYQKD